MRSILISAQRYEPSTDLVIDYLIFLGLKVKRLHSEEIISGVDIYLDSDSMAEDRIEIWGDKGRKVHEGISNMWYRRGAFSYKFPINSKVVDPKLQKYLGKEWEKVKFFLNESLVRIPELLTPSFRSTDPPVENSR